MTLRLRGPVDRAALRAALRDVIDRHEVLRTVFPQADGGPVQHILTGAEVRLPWQEIDCPAESAAAELTAGAQHVFDLAAEVPLRATLVRCGPEDHRFSLVMHHIVADGWSLDPLLNDLTAAYTARCAGREPDWEPLPVQYADYALWQRDLLGEESDPGSVANTQLAYWTQDTGRAAGRGDVPARPATAGRAGPPRRPGVGDRRRSAAPRRDRAGQRPSRPRCSWCCRRHWPRC